MQLIGEISEQKLQLSDHNVAVNRNGSRYWFRRAARAVVQNDKNEIALLHVTKHNYYKLPGGGIEAQEHATDALKREVLEEVGVDIVIQDEIGLVIEYRDAHELIQFSYCFLAQAIGGENSVSFTADELESLHWYPLEDAISIMEQTKPDDYAGIFIRARDQMILKKLRAK